MMIINLSEAKVKILCVEDDDRLCRLYKRKLEHEGYSVTTANDGEQGLAMCQAEIYDVVLIDYQIPILNGLDLIHALAELPHTPPSIMISGTAELSIPIKAMKLGAVDYIIKGTGDDYLELLLVTIKKVIVQQRIKEDKVRIKSELLLADAVFKNTTEAIMVTDYENIIQMVNPSFTTITGYTKAAVVGKKASFLESVKNDPSFLQKKETKLKDTGQWEGEIWSQNNCGKDYPQQLSINSVFDNNGILTHYVALFHDITKRRQHEKQIWYQANFDVLTDLPNRALFMDRLEQALHQAQRNKTQGALLFIDLDHFKEINDTYGHNAGDKVLQIVAKHLKKCTREVDTSARLAGDEFTIILADIAKIESAKIVADKLLQQFSKPIVLPDNSEITIGCSIGIALFPNDISNVDELLHNADSAMYRAKAAGRNVVEIFIEK